MASSSASASRPFPGRVRQQLCEHLLQLPEMPTPARRDHVIRQMTQDFPGLHSVARQDTPHADILEFVTAAYDYPGALRRLFDILLFLYGEDKRLRPIRELIASVEPEDLLTDTERQAILEQIANVDPAVVASAFHYSTRITVAEAGFEQSDVAAIVTMAEGFPASAERLPPLFELIDYIAHRSPRSARASLHAWMDLVSHRLGHAQRSAVDVICRATEIRLVRNGRNFLVTEVSPDHSARDHYYLAAWRQYEDEPEQVLYQADHSVPWEKAIDTIHLLMQELARIVIDAAEERILELIVPRGLVTQPIDQWTVDPVLPSPIGTVYPLVLRSLDRLNDPTTHRDWGRNWAWLKGNGRTAGITAFRPVNSHDHDAAQALRIALLRDGPPAAVLMLQSLPASDELAPDAYTAGIRGGAPIMIWSRDASTATDLADWIGDVCQEDLLDLPGRAFQLRLRALDDTDATPAARHVTLIYDDHDRIPERFRSRSRLRSPQKRK